MEYTILLWILSMTIIDGLLAFSGVFSFLMKKKTLDKILIFLVAFATGALIGGAFLHLLPESIDKLKWPLTIILSIFGIISFYFVEKLLHWHYCKEGECKDHRHPFTYLILIGNAIHNFIDGLLIASAFLISTKIGIVTSILIIAHELPHEIGNFSVLVYGGFSRGKALLYNFLIQLTAVLGGLLGFFFLSINDYSAYLLPVAAGGFIYLSLFDLLPEIFEKKTTRIRMILNIVFLILGILLLLSAKLLVG